MILIIKHIAIEGPGTIGDFFRTKGYTLRTIELEKGENLPESLDEVEAVVVLGGPMNVYEEERYPFLGEENIFIRRVVEEKIPFLGICLGGQLLAKAFTAGVKKASEKEIGWYKVSLTGEGQKDALFDGLGKDFEVFQWHEDMFEVPPKGRLLASSSACCNQAFRIGEKAYGLQFHFEVSGEMINDWTREYFDSGLAALQKKAEEMFVRYEAVEEDFRRTAEKICTNFEKLI